MEVEAAPAIAGNGVATQRRGPRREIRLSGRDGPWGAHSKGARWARWASTEVNDEGGSGGEWLCLHRFAIDGLMAAVRSCSPCHRDGTDPGEITGPMM